MNPLDSGFVDICFGDSILFVATPIFPYSEETTGFGYSQDVDATIDFEWDITDGETYPNNDSIWFTPPARAGYLIDLLLTDEFPQIERLRCKIRVSQLPSFAGTAGITAPGRNTAPTWTVTSPEAWRFTPNGTPNYTIAWFQGINQIGNSATINVCPVGTTTYTAQVTYTMCNGTTVQETDQVNVSYSSAVPVINLTSVNETCAGVSNGTATASPSGGAPGYTYSWNTIPIQTTQTATGLSAGTYTCAVTDANGCVATQNVTITANNPTISGILSVCVGVTSQLTGSDSTNVGTLWASSMGGVATVSSTGLVTGVSIGTTTITYTNSLGCTTTASVTITAAPSASISYAGSPFCNTLSSAQDVTQTGTTGGTYSSTTGLIIDASTGAITPSTSTAGTYTVTYTIAAAGCAALSTTTSVTITAAPTATIIYANSPYCKTVTTAQAVTQTGVTGGAYTASPIGLSINASLGAITPSTSSVGTFIVSYTLATSGGCAAVTTTASVTILAAPTIFSDTLSCDYVYQVAGTTAANGGVWSSSDPLIYISDVLANNPQISTVYAGIYPVSFTDNTCNVTLTASIEFPPLIDTQVLDTNICLGASFELAPLILNTASSPTLSEWTLQAGYNPTTTWYWENGSTDIPRMISAAGSYVFTLQNDCDVDSDTAIIGIKPCDIIAPNIVVLSSSSGNNLFYVNSQGLVEFNCIILNRWGNVIYEYSDPAGGWDGKTEDGNKVEEGTYFYRIRATLEGGEELIKHGFVVVKY